MRGRRCPVLTPKSFDYFAPKTLREAITLLQKKEESKVLAGGQSLLALMKLRLAAPKYLIDITQVPNLSYIKEQQRHIKIGALTTHDAIENSSLIRKRLPILAEAASKIGDQQIRNRGTLGGTACHADPAADMLPALVALEAEFVVTGPRKERIIPAKGFFVDFFTTAVRANEVLREIRIPTPPPGTGSAYIKHSRREGDFAIVGVAALLTVDDRNLVKDVRLGLGAVAPTALRATSAESLLRGKQATEENFIAAAEKAPEGTNPVSDVHGSAEYRREMVKVFVKRALRLALTRIKGGR